MRGRITVDTGQLFHLSQLLGTSSEALLHNDQCPDRGQVGNDGVHQSLTHFFSNWKHKRLDLGEKLQKLSAGVAAAAVAYLALEKQLREAFVVDPGSSSTVRPPAKSGGSSAGAGGAGNAATRKSNEYGKSGDSAGKLAPSGGSAEYHAQVSKIPSTAAVYKGGWSEGYKDKFGMQYENCTSWAAFRRNQLGLSAPSGHGGLMASNASEPPRLGSIVSAPSGGWGHVMIVEEIYPNGSFRVSEMNHDGKGGFLDSRIWTPVAGGWHASDHARNKVTDLRFKA